MTKQIKLQELILFSMFLLLPIDMLNGFLLHSNINLPLSIAQVYKFIILLFLFLSFLYKPNKLLISLTLIGLLLIPSLFQIIKRFEISFLFNDLIKVIRYLTPVFSFFFFVNYVKKGKNMDLIFNLIKFSFFFFSFNILLKYLGLGYPMYNYGSIGSKGFFYAGNETSVVLIVLSSILAYRLWLNREVKKYFLFFLFTLFVGFTISSKTGMLGVILIFILIPIKVGKLKITPKKKLRSLLLLIILVPFLITVMIKILINSSIFLRLQYFWNELDFVTFIFSNRNNFFADSLNMYAEKYNFIEKIIGVGQFQYEILNGNSIVEIDIADIFFAYGVIGLIIFISLIIFLVVQAYKFKKSKKHPFAGLVIVMLFVLLAISTIAGHVYSSGMAAVFIGLLFSLMYIKKERIENQ